MQKMAMAMLQLTVAMLVILDRVCFFLSFSCTPKTAARDHPYCFFRDTEEVA